MRWRWAVVLLRLRWRAGPLRSLLGALLPALLPALLKAWQERAGGASLRLPPAGLLLGSRRRHDKARGAARRHHQQMYPAARHAGHIPNIKHPSLLRKLVKESSRIMAASPVIRPAAWPPLGRPSDRARGSAPAQVTDDRGACVSL
jgi:hypothetical protein